MNVQGQGVTRIEAAQLKARVEALKQDGFRLVQIDCVGGEGFELSYSFGKALRLVTLRVLLPGREPKIRSIGDLYFSAALYENELHDLFGVEIEGLALDYHGTFYRTRVRTPYAPAAAAPGEGPAQRVEPPEPGMAGGTQQGGG
jgi:ech hydrogenase subunit D